MGKTKLQALEMLQQVYGDSTMSCTCVFVGHRRFKEGQEEVKHYSRLGKPLTAGLRSLLLSGLGKWCVIIIGWLFKWLQVSGTWKKTVFGRLSTKIWISLKSNGTGCTEHIAVPCQEENHPTETTSLFPWSCSMQLFSFLHHQGHLFWRCGSNQKSCKDRSEGHPRRTLQAVHRSVANSRESALDLKDIDLKGISCNFLLGIEMNCLWHQCCYFSSTSCSLYDVLKYRIYIVFRVNTQTCSHQNAINLH